MLKNVGKVFKYEFKHASKTLVPMYTILLIMGLLIGVFLSPFSSLSSSILDNEAQLNSNGLYYEYNGNESMYQQQVETQLANTFAKTVAFLIISILFAMYTAAVFIVTIVVVSSRFKTSMLGDEAYLNLVLPVSMGEHIWGRFLSSFVWIILCFITNAVSSVLCLIRSKINLWLPQYLELIEENSPADFSITTSFTLSFVISVLFCSSIILLVYFVNSLGNLSPKNKTIIKFSSTILFFFVTIYLPSWIRSFILLFTDEISGTIHQISTISSLFILCILYMTVTHIIFNKKLNLE